MFDFEEAPRDFKGYSDVYWSILLRGFIAREHLGSSSKESEWPREYLIARAVQNDLIEVVVAHIPVEILNGSPFYIQAFFRKILYLVGTNKLVAVPPHYYIAARASMYKYQQLVTVDAIIDGGFNDTSHWTNLFTAYEENHELLQTPIQHSLN